VFLRREFLEIGWRNYPVIACIRYKNLAGTTTLEIVVLSINVRTLTSIKGSLYHLSLAKIPSLLKLLTFSHRPAKSVSMMKMLLKLMLNILLRPQSNSDLALENFALRQQLAIWKRRKKRPQIRTKDRLFWVVLSRFWSNWREALVIVKPDTVVRWYKRVSSCSGNSSPDVKALGVLRSTPRSATFS
jgi:hypothetical protein